MISLNAMRPWLGGLVLMFVLGGCGSRDHDAVIREINATNAQRLVTLYQKYQMDHRMQGPKDEESFRAFIGDVHPIKLKRMDVDVANLDGLFLSDRDGQPLDIRYGLKGSDRGPAIPTIFEREGVDGKRLVAFTNMVTKEIEDESEFEQLLSGKLDGQETYE